LDALSQFSEKFFSLKPSEGKSKILPLREAVQQHIRPGMHIYSSYLPFSTVHEIVRQFRSLDACFTVSCLGAVDNVNMLVAAGLVNRLIGSYAALILPSPVISGVIQRGLQDGMEIENWSLLTMVQRLIGGALNLPFMPTSSLDSSTIAEENEQRQLYAKVLDPFGNSRIGVVKSLKPDITIMHTYCADASGNAIPVLPPAEEAYGAFASREGVVLSTEKIVSTEYLREHSAFVKVPSSIVKCVVEAPFGAHPFGCRGHDGDGYGEDAEFSKQLQKAFREKPTTEAWLKEWILDVKTHSEYLRKLGSERLEMLRGRISYLSWKTDASEIAKKLSNAPANRAERAAIWASREIISAVESHGYNTILAGIGISHLAAWVATHKLREKAVSVDLLVELGLSGLIPPPGQPFLAPVRGMGSCPMLTDVLGVLGFVANGTRMMGSLSAGQVDRYGNINSTKVGDFFLFGSGGANDVSVKAKEIVVTVLQDPRRLVDKVPYVTCPGQNVSKLVTDRAVFEKVDGELTLNGIFVDENETEEHAVEAVMQSMEWEPKKTSQLVRLSEPEPEEILMLRFFDPERYYLGKVTNKT